MNVSETIDRTIEKAKEIFGGEKKSSVHSWMGSNPHAEFEQSHPAVNKEEPAAFANPEEAGAKRASEEVYGKTMPQAMTDDIQPGSSASCAGEVHRRMGSNPHTRFEQGHPAVNKEEPRAFANPCESGAKKASEDVIGKPMPKPDAWTHARSV
jgi:hypothetical protein